jgi:uncharacterized protein
MKLFYFRILVIVISSAGNPAHGQGVPNFNPATVMSRAELKSYRQSIWDTLPAAVGWVNDFEGIFKPEEGDSLEGLIAHFEKKTSIEIAILSVDTNMVDQARFSDFTGHVLRVWGIGKKLKRNGIVICISRGYQEMEIVTGAGIESYMGEPEKFEIIKKVFIPQYKKNKYYEGTLAGLEAILQKISGRMFVHL